MFDLNRRFRFFCDATLGTWMDLVWLIYDGKNSFVHVLCIAVFFFFFFSDNGLFCTFTGQQRGHSGHVWQPRQDQRGGLFILKNG